MRWWIVASTAAAGCSGGDGAFDPLVQEGACAPEREGRGDVPLRSECAGDGVQIDAPWEVQQEWSFTAGGESVVSPVTGQLTDDDGDGTIDDDDVPDVAFVSYTDGHLYVVSGDGSGLLCSSPDWDPDGAVILADVDGDGRNEVVGMEAGAQRVRAVDGDCQPVWTSAETYAMRHVVITAADLDGDGVVEVIADHAVLDGRTGGPIARLVPEDDRCWRAPFTGDFDQDGQIEIMLGNTMFSSSGEPMWSAPGSGTTCVGGVANLDDDPQGEIFLSHGYDFTVYEHDGTPIWSAPLTLPNPGPPCAGDLDGDGEAEIVVPHGFWMTAFEADGTEMWSVAIDDGSGSAACSVFDLDGDRAYEVIHADEKALRILDGRTGAVRWERRAHRSVTFFEAPTVADVDGDGSAELIVASSTFSLDVDGGVTAYGHGGAGWPTTGTTWGLHDFSGTNQEADGGIPQAPVAPWLAHNVFRGQPFPAGSPNLTGEVTEVCASSCGADGVVRVAVRIENDGGAAAPATTAALYQGQTRVARLPVPAIPPGATHPTVVFEVPAASWTGEGLVRLDDDGVVDECDEADNALGWTEQVCPE